MQKSPNSLCATGVFTEHSNNALEFSLSTLKSSYSSVSLLLDEHRLTRALLFLIVHRVNIERSVIAHLSLSKSTLTLWLLIRFPLEHFGGILLQ